MPNTSPDPLTATSGYHDAVRAQRTGAASVDARLWLSMAEAAHRLGADGMARDCAARAYAMATGRDAPTGAIVDTFSADTEAECLAWLEQTATNRALRLEMAVRS